MAGKMGKTVKIYKLTIISSGDEMYSTMTKVNNSVMSI